MKQNISNSTIIRMAEQFNDQPHVTEFSDYWNHFAQKGTSLWLDTGDIDGAKQLWNSSFSALTTNNTLLNAEVQKGIYDKIIPELASQLSDLNEEEKTKEIALCLNAIHGLRIARIFNCKVSVELHTYLANDIEGILNVGKRLFNINPKQFIVKVPLTPSGLIGARKLHEEGIPVNFTLDFSVRQNGIAAVLARPVYTNVFLGRIGAYLSSNELGESLHVGEKVTHETQLLLRSLHNDGMSKTKLIAASIRSKDQLLTLLGTDTFTIPVAVAGDAVKTQMQIDDSYKKEIPYPVLFDNVSSEALRLNRIWELQDNEKELIHHLYNNKPQTADELVEITQQFGCYDIFPTLTADEHNYLRTDGKIPKHSRWAEKIKEGKAGIDSLLNLAGLYSFEKDQAALDDRIKNMI